MHEPVVVESMIYWLCCYNAWFNHNKNQRNDAIGSQLHLFLLQNLGAPCLEKKKMMLRNFLINYSAASLFCHSFQKHQLYF